MTAFWTPELIWSGETAYLLGGGPSLRNLDLVALRGRRVLTINSSLARAVESGLDDGVLFFSDADWLIPRHDAVAAWRGPVVTSSRVAKEAMPAKLKWVQGEWRPSFPLLGSPVIRRGCSSGHTAIGLSVALGCSRIVLLGFDMRAVDGRTHHHDEYEVVNAMPYAKRFEMSFVPAFMGWNAAAMKVGVEILNATPGSILLEFPMVNLDEVLNCAPS